MKKALDIRPLPDAEGWRSLPDAEGWWVKWRNYGGAMMRADICRICRGEGGKLYFWSGFAYPTRMPAERLDKDGWYGPFSREDIAQKFAADNQRPNAEVRDRR